MSEISSSPSLSSSQSWSSLGSSSSPCLGVRMFSTPEVPCGLRRLDRSPKEILGKKVQLERDTKASVTRQSSVMMVEREIEMKLFYLNIIRRLGDRKSDVSSREERELQLRIWDREQQMRQARHMVERGERERRILEEEVGLARKERDLLFQVMEERKSLNAESLAVCRMKIYESEQLVAELGPVDGHVSDLPDKSDKLSSLTANCLQFNNLFALSGQLADFCHGEHGSNFVVKRLVEGTEPERGLLRTELNLPQALSTCLASQHCRKVVLAMVETDKVFRGEMLKEISRNVDWIVQETWGPDFLNRALCGKN